MTFIAAMSWEKMQTKHAASLCARFYLNVNNLKILKDVIQKHLLYVKFAGNFRSVLRMHLFFSYFYIKSSEIIAEQFLVIGYNCSKFSCNTSCIIHKYKGSYQNYKIAVINQL